MTAEAILEKVTLLPVIERLVELRRRPSRRIYLGVGRGDAVQSGDFG